MNSCVQNIRFELLISLSHKRPAELVNGWTADTKNSTRRDWRWAKLNNDYVEWPTGHEMASESSTRVSLDASEILHLLGAEFEKAAADIENYVDNVRDTYADFPKVKSLKRKKYMRNCFLGGH